MRELLELDVSLKRIPGRVTVDDLAGKLDELYGDEAGAPGLLIVKELRAIIRGQQRPQAKRAFQIGQALLEMNRCAWSGCTMLLAAGWLGDFLGTFVCYLESPEIHPNELAAMRSYVRDIPAILFHADLATAAYDDVICFEDDMPYFANQRKLGAIERRNRARKRWADFGLDRTLLNRAWKEWEDEKIRNRGGILHRARLLDNTSVDAAVREQQAYEYLHDELRRLTASAR